MFIAGFDIATSCGVADGEPGKRPRCWTWDLRRAGATRPARLALLMAYCERYFAENHVDALFYEAGMTARVAVHIGCQDDTFALLRGAIGVVEACAGRARIPVIRAVNVQDARKHFVGQRSFAKGMSKQRIFEHCKLLRWPAKNLDESDACAIWDWGCAQVSPQTSYVSAPLFAGR